MLEKIMKKILSLFIIIIAGCYPVSHIVVGDVKPPISPEGVKLYLDYPNEYEKIALIDAGSNFALKDPDILFTWQSKSNKVIERLKIAASELGANGIVIVGTDNKVHQSLAVDGEGSVTSNSYIEKFGKAVAIYVKAIDD
tara:strand:- start:148 stop:567 length:420 start_codon:yes stop_codon:yes gene_type:complete